MIFTSPTHIILPRKTKADKKIQLNLNTYRNLHYRTNNDVKKIYCKQMKAELIDVDIFSPMEVTFQLYRTGKRLVDKNNIYSIVAKFFYDAMVFYGCIPDDNDNYIKREIYEPTIYNADINECIITV